jgi:hypothetical protein
MIAALGPHRSDNDTSAQTIHQKLMYRTQMRRYTSYTLHRTCGQRGVYYTSKLMYSLMYRYTAIHSDTSNVMYHPGSLLPCISCKPFFRRNVIYFATEKWYRSRGDLLEGSVPAHPLEKTRNQTRITVRRKPVGISPPTAAHAAISRPRASPSILPSTSTALAAASSSSDSLPGKSSSVAGDPSHLVGAHTDCHAHVRMSCAQES